MKLVSRAFLTCFFKFGWLAAAERMDSTEDVPLMQLQNLDLPNNKEGHALTEKRDDYYATSRVRDQVTSGKIDLEYGLLENKDLGMTPTVLDSGRPEAGGPDGRAPVFPVRPEAGGRPALLENKDLGMTPTVLDSEMEVKQKPAGNGRLQAMMPLENQARPNDGGPMKLPTFKLVEDPQLPTPRLGNEDVEDFQHRFEMVRGPCAALAVESHWSDCLRWLDYLKAHPDVLKAMNTSCTGRVLYVPYGTRPVQDASCTDTFDKQICPILVALEWPLDCR